MTVTGTGFLHAGGVTPVALGGLLGAADVTAHFSAQELGQVLHDGDAALDALVQQLHAVGVDHLALDAGQVADLAHAHFSFDPGTAITVTGTGFLHAAAPDDLHALLGAADVTVKLSEQDLNAVLSGENAHVGLETLASHLHAAGADALELDAGQAIDLAQSQAPTEGWLSNGGLEVRIDDPLALAQTADAAELDALRTLFEHADTTANLEMDDLRNEQFGSVDDLHHSLDELQTALAHAGVDSIEIDDALANALAEADSHFNGTGPELVVVAQADAQAGDGSTAYLEASLADLAKLGVDEVHAAAGVDRITLAAHDALQSGASDPGFTIDDLPHFHVPAGTEVDLVVTADDLAALLQHAGAFEQLEDLGIDKLLYAGDGSDPDYAAALSASLPIELAHLNATEVQLLGLGEEPANPLDPFHKHS